MSKVQRIGRSLLGFAVISCAFSGASVGQSLDADKPFPMKAGANRGAVDNFVGANYFYFWAEPGESTVRASFKSMGLLGASMRSTLTVQMSDEKRTWKSRKEISSANASGEVTFSGKVEKRTKVIVAVIPPSGGLLRSGGDYEVEATGAVSFDAQPGAIELLAGTYTPKLIYENEDTAVKFLPDGTLEFASGTQGRWKLFDAGERVFTVTYRNTRLSLKLMPGRGLVEAKDPSSIVFQRMR